MRVGMADIAEKVGVSVSTVSYAFSGRRKVAAETKRRILDAARELNYPIPSSTFEKRTKARVVAVSAPIHSYSSLNGYSAFFFETLGALRKRGYDLLLCAGEDDELDRIARENLADGVVLLDVKENDPRAQSAENLSMPVVSIGLPNGPSSSYKRLFCIDLDFISAAKVAIQHAAEMGRTHILFIAAHEQAYKEGANYLVRFKKALQRHALQYSVAVHILYKPAHVADLPGLIREMLAAHPEINGIIAQTDTETAPLIINAVKKETEDGHLGLVIVGGYGRLNTAQCHVDEIPLEPKLACQRAIDVLISRISGDLSTSGKVELISPNYLDRGTFKAQ
ncbi:LacI family DNA-binding transcriptional regulator [Alloscardovia criceti]|uniref:LacI family DNA-binding transcriptional regulator n=1 Tax=Alloscardovia criceti TaxID=356828 RepID=UPI00036EF8C2|nr:LacI family DNA-binding transcriptional regulator [Alloscardovia criceti]